MSSCRAFHTRIGPPSPSATTQRLKAPAIVALSRVSLSLRYPSLPSPLCANLNAGEKICLARLFRLRLNDHTKTQGRRHHDIGGIKWRVQARVFTVHLWMLARSGHSWYVCVCALVYVCVWAEQTARVHTQTSPDAHPHACSLPPSREEDIQTKTKRARMKAYTRHSCCFERSLLKC